MHWRDACDACDCTEWRDADAAATASARPPSSGERYRAAAEAQGTDLASVAREAWERMAKRAERAEREV